MNSIQPNPKEKKVPGYVYCAYTLHRKYRYCVKIGCTDRTPELRMEETTEKWAHQFYLLWAIPVLDSRGAEAAVHLALKPYHREFEFFAIKPRAAEQVALEALSDRWRDMTRDVFRPENPLQATTVPGNVRKR